MSEHTVTEPADNQKPERIPPALVWLRIAGAIIDGLPAPEGVRIYTYPDNYGIVSLDAGNVAAADAWGAWFGAEHPNRHIFPDGRPHVGHYVKWEGWSVQIYGTDPQPTALPELSEADEATALPELSEADEAIASDIRNAVQP